MSAASAARDSIEDFCKEATCSVCQEYFNDPVTLECGHNFCRACLTQFWEKSGTTETSCPQCREKVLRSNLRPNQTLANFVEITKKLSLQGPKKAEGEERVCEKQHEPLNIFCEDDETDICVLCDRSKEHEDERVIPLGPPAQDYKVNLAASAAKDPIEDEVTCCICLEYFKVPVTLECGHNFCRDCVIQFWEKSVTKETSCPQCREKVQQRKLKSNWQLANIIEITKKLPQRPQRAEGKERICEKHQDPLKLFCKDDETPICLVCDRSKEHKDHTAIPVEEASQDYKDLMGNHQDTLEKEKEKILVYKAETEKGTQALLKQTEAEMENILGEITEIRRFLEEQEKQLRVQMEELKKQIARKRDENLAIFDQELSSLENFIQELKEKCQQPPLELLQDVKSLLQRSQEKKTFEKPVASSAELKWKIWELCDLKLSLVPVVKQFQDALLPVLELQKENVTLDPDTAGPWLILSEDHKSVRREGKCQDLPDNPERFNPRAFVLGREGFKRGRHFWDVDVGRGGDWAVGVAKTSVRRKGPININPSEGIWAVGKWKGSYHAPSHSSRSVLSLSEKTLSEKTERIRVCLNCAANRVAFYDADTGAQICVFSEVPFSRETVLPFFYTHEGGHLKISP